jgi:hypothetical protein
MVPRGACGSSDRRGWAERADPGDPWAPRLGVRSCTEVAPTLRQWCGPGIVVSTHHANATPAMHDPPITIHATIRRHRGTDGYGLMSAAFHRSTAGWSGFPWSCAPPTSRPKVRSIAAQSVVSSAFTGSRNHARKRAHMHRWYSRSRFRSISRLKTRRHATMPIPRNHAGRPRRRCCGICRGVAPVWPSTEGLSR